MKENQLARAQQVVKALLADINKAVAQEPATLGKDERLKALSTDLTGQITEAISRADYYKKWGMHYLPSLLRAHLLQQCNNFKDPGVQHFGGGLFKVQRDEVDNIFCKLPPPKPSVERRTSSGAPAARAPASMSVYNRASNPCFAGHCQALMADGSQRPVAAIHRGDSVRTADGGVAQVLCVLETLCRDGKAFLVELPGNLLITPYHPVRVNGHWHFPCDLAPVFELPCDAVYSFVLSRGHVMLVQGVECVGLGHNFSEPVVAHPFFGSRAVLDQLQTLDGWQQGHIQLHTGCLVRDATSGLVCAIQQQPLMS